MPILAFLMGVGVGLVIGLIIGVFLYIFAAIGREDLESTFEEMDRRAGQIKENQKGANQGFVYHAPSEADEVREKIISENDKKGVDTPLQDLQN